MVKEDYIYLVWQDPKTRQRMVVGELKKQDGYKFFYTGQYKKAKELGWKMLRPFPEEKEYQSKKMFPVFSCRLPDSKRRDIDAILKEYELEKYDEYELLKKSGARLPIDSYEFVDPIFPDDETIHRKFYISGVRHVAECDGEECQCMNGIKAGDELELMMEPDKSVDQFAVALYTKDGSKIGYVPAYYSEQVTHRLKLGMTYLCEVLEVNCEKQCRECIRVILQMPRED